MSFVEDLGALVSASRSPLVQCPEEWPRVPLRSVAKIINGYPFPSGGFNSTKGTPVARIRDVVRGRSETYFEGIEVTNALIGDGDILVGMDGDFNLGCWRGGRALLNQRVCKIAVDAAQLDYRYLAYVLPGYLKLINDNTPSLTVKHLSSRTLGSVPLPLPPLNVQQRLAQRIDELFSELDYGDEELRRARAELETYRKSLLKAAVTGELTADWRAANPPQKRGADLLLRILTDRRARWEADPKSKGKRYKEPIAPDIASLPDLPEGWTWASLSQIAFVSGGLTVDSKRKPLHAREVPYLRVANVQRGRLALDKIKTMAVSPEELERLTLREGDILLNEGGDRDKVGRGWVWEGQLPVCIHQNHVFKARPVNDLVVPKLVSMYLNELGRKFFIDQGKQTTNLASISLTKVSAAPVAVPPLREGQQIVEVLKALQYDAESEECDVAAASEAASILRQSVLAAAFRGELVQ